MFSFFLSIWISSLKISTVRLLLFIRCANNAVPRDFFVTDNEKKLLTLWRARTTPVEKHDGYVTPVELNTRVTTSDKSQAVFVASSEIWSSPGRSITAGSTSSFWTPQLVDQPFPIYAQSFPSSGTRRSNISIAFSLCILFFGSNPF